MAKFKVGDRVKILWNKSSYSKVSDYGEEGTIIPNRGERGDYQVSKFDRENLTASLGFYERELELVTKKRGRPAKPKPVKFIAVYDEEDGDPLKEFTSRTDLMKWLEEAFEDDNIVFDSIKVYPAGKPMKVETSFKLKEVKKSVHLL